MKKILSLSLAVLMLCTLFTVNTFAETFVIGGTGGVTVEDFTATDRDVNGTVSVKVTSVTHKYSVDITYSNMVYTMPSLTWDPSEQNYVGGTGNLGDVVEITLQNFSDLPVYATATFAYADGCDPKDGSGLGFKFDEEYTKVVLPAATIGKKGDEVNFTGRLTGFDTPDKIAEAIFYYEGLGRDTITIGTYTVTISKDA